ncbi:MAG TPA: DUF3592 domain-containing protein [Ignavibacteria bacterium]|nr:hypothetical protein [Bacteroidota bacterium]HRE09890.1 DUF3592 domain-containing protein [Ignavibacteria bacterium]HRF66420.1 DUF3592 domain-containing protein [Ignavibacteria bacterium]HRJ85403.1 DUF3592 domain-containing protein [Ignavibacteria bacterium]
MTQSELFLVIGVNGLISFIMLVIGIISYVRVKKFLASAIETRGIVVQSVFKSSGDDGSGSMYSPLIRFKDTMGREHEFTENWSTNRPDYRIGDEVIVFYNPEKPHKARRGGKKWKFYFVAWLVGGMGILFSAILIFFIIIMLFLPMN